MMRREFLSIASIAGAAPLIAAADSAWIDITRFGAKPGGDASAGECGALEDVIVQNAVAHDATVPSSVTGVAARRAANVMLSDLRITMAGGGAAELATRAVSERETAYPDGRTFGDLPAHGLYARHVDGLSLRNIDISCDKADARPVAIVDDVMKLSVEGLRQAGVPADVRRIGAGGDA